MKLTMTGKVETILGVMRKLDICDAKFNINDGFVVDLDSTTEIPKEPGNVGLVADEATISTPKRRGRKKKVHEPTDDAQVSAPAKKRTFTVECKLCFNKFAAPHPRQSFCPECLSMYGGVEKCHEKLKKLSGGSTRHVNTGIDPDTITT